MIAAEYITASNGVKIKKYTKILPKFAKCLGGEKRMINDNELFVRVSSSGGKPLIVTVTDLDKVLGRAMVDAPNVQKAIDAVVENYDYIAKK